MSYIRNSKQIFTPTTGQSIAISDSDGDIYILIKPAGTLLALTITMPANPRDGQSITLCSTQIITGLTLTSSSTINGLITTLAAVNGYATYVYDLSNTMYFRAG
jgi:hypothetical protein